MLVIISNEARRTIVLATTAFKTAVQSGREAIRVSGKSEVVAAFLTALDTMEKNASVSWSRSQVSQAALIIVLQTSFAVIEELANGGQKDQASNLAAALGNILPNGIVVDEDLKVPLMKLRELSGEAG